MADGEHEAALRTALFDFASGRPIDSLDHDAGQGVGVPVMAAGDVGRLDEKGHATPTTVSAP